MLEPRWGRHRVCRRLVGVAALTLTGHVGVNTVTFSARLAHRRLKPGDYTVEAQASGTAGRSQTLSVSFRVAG